MQNRHEQLIHDIAQSAIGALSVVEPLEVPKPKGKHAGNTEPADLILLGRGVVVLCYLCCPEPSANTEKDERKFGKAVEHNLGQARARIRQWRERQLPILGESALGPIQFVSGDDQLVVLSIVDSPVAKAIYHAEQEQDLGAALCCTIPGVCLEYMATKQLTLIDLLRFIRALRQVDRPMSSEEVLEQLAATVHHAWMGSGAVEVWPVPDDDWRGKIAWLRRLRVSSTAPRHVLAGAINGNKTALREITSIFNDMPLEDLLGLLVGWIQLDKATEAPGQEAVIMICGAFHNVILAVQAGDPNTSRVPGAMENLWRKQSNGELLPGPSITKVKSAGGAMIACGIIGDRSHARSLCLGRFDQVVKPFREYWA